MLSQIAYFRASLERQGYREYRLAGLATHQHAALITIDNFFDDGQSKAQPKGKAISFGGHIGLEDVIHEFRGYTGAIIGYVHPQLALTTTRTDVDAGFGGLSSLQGISRIFNEVDPHL